MEERVSVFLSVVSICFICGGGVLWVRGSKEGGGEEGGEGGEGGGERRENRGRKREKGGGVKAMIHVQDTRCT